VQIRETFEGSVGLLDTGGGTIPSEAASGRLVAHLSYDALGRLIRVQRPSSDSGGVLHVTDLYYDGVRVVQEVADHEVFARLSDTGDLVLPRAAYEMAFGATGATEGVTPQAGECATPQEHDPEWAWSSRRLEREYIWHADPSSYVDEVAVQLVYTGAHDAGGDSTPTVLYALTDRNADVACC
jgi:hypothetical protein